MKHVVEFPECLDLSPYLLETSESCATAGNSQYRLSAVVVHLGQGLHSGHYTAYVHPTSSTGVTTPWFLVNDDVVRRVTWQEVLAQPPTCCSTSASSPTAAPPLPLQRAP